MKLLIADIDKTLYFNDREEKISSSDLKQISKFQAAGNLFGVCTGRSYVGTKAAVSGFPIKLDFMILASGAIIILEEDNVLKQSYLSKQIAQSIYDIVKSSVDRGKCVMTLTSDTHYYYYGDVNFPFENTVKIENISQIPESKFTNIDIQAQEDDVVIEVKELLDKTLKGKFEVHRNTTNLDIAPKNCDKGIAIKELQAHLKVDDNDLNVIGDSYNDIPMFNVVDNSFTFNGSNEQVKKQTKYFVDSIAEAIDIILK